MYFVDFGLVKLIVTLASECKYKLMNFVDDINGFFMPVKKDPGLFPEFFNFVDKIHRYFVPVKKPPGLLPAISSYICDNMEYPLKWAEWMISTKTGLCVTAGLSLYFVYRRRNRTEKCCVAGSLVAYAMKDSPLVQDSVRHINQWLTTHSLLDIGTAMCMAAGLTFYFVKRRNRTEKTFVGACILAFAMRNTSVMQGPLRYVNSLLPLTGFELSAVTGLILYFLYRNNNREKIYVAGSFLIFIFRDSAVVQVPIICGLLLLSAAIQFVVVVAVLGGGVCCVGGLTMYFYQRESIVEKSCVAGSLLALAYWFRDTPPIQWVSSVLFSKSGMLIVVTAGVAIYLIFFRKKKMTPDLVYSRTFNNYQPYIYEEVYYHEELDNRNYYEYLDIDNRNYYRSDSDDEVFIPPVKIVPFQPQSLTHQVTFQPQSLTRQATLQPQSLPVTYLSQNQDGLKQVDRVWANETPYESKPKKKRGSKKKKPELLETPPFAGVSNSPKQSQYNSKVNRNEDTRIVNVPGPSAIDHSNNCQCNTTKRKKGKVNHVAFDWPAKSMVIENNDNTVKTNAECIQKQLLLKNTGKASVPSNGKGKRDGLSVSNSQKQQSHQVNNQKQPNVQKQQINQPSVQKQQLNQPNIQKEQINQPNIQKEQINQPNIQEQPNNLLDKTTSIAGPSNSRGIQNSGNPSPVPEQRTHQPADETSQENNQSDWISVPLRRPNNPHLSTNDAPNEKFVVRVKLD